MAETIESLRQERDEARARWRKLVDDMEANSVDGWAQAARKSEAALAAERVANAGLRGLVRAALRAVRDARRWKDERKEWSLAAAEMELEVATGKHLPPLAMRDDLGYPSEPSAALSAAPPNALRVGGVEAERVLAEAREYCEFMFSPEWLANPDNRSIFAAHIYRILTAAVPPAAAPQKTEHDPRICAKCAARAAAPASEPETDAGRLLLVVQEAVAAEREECAKVADRCEAAQFSARAVAHNIRLRAQRFATGELPSFVSSPPAAEKP